MTPVGQKRETKNKAQFRLTCEKLLSMSLSRSDLHATLNVGFAKCGFAPSAEKGRIALSSRRGANARELSLPADWSAYDAQSEIKQLQQNKTILSVLTVLSTRFRGTEEGHVITVRLENSDIEIYAKPTRRHIFPGKVAIAPGESVIYRWVCNQNEVRVCYYTNSLKERPTSIKAQLLLASCGRYPTKGSCITL